MSSDMLRQIKEKEKYDIYLVKIYEYVKIFLFASNLNKFLINMIYRIYLKNCQYVDALENTISFRINLTLILSWI